MKLTDIINEEGFQDKKERLIKKTEAYYRIFRIGTFDHSIKHSLRNYDRMETHTFQYKLSEFHKVIVPFGSNIPTLICDVHVTDITDGDMGGNYDPITIYIIRGYLKRIFNRKDIEISIKNATGDVESNEGLFEQEEEGHEDITKNHDTKQLKKAESIYKFYKRGSMIIYPDGQKKHTVDYVLSDNPQFNKFDYQNGFYIKVPEINLFVRSKELYDSLLYHRELEKQAIFKASSELEIIKNKIIKLFRKKNLDTDIKFSPVKIKLIKPQLNEEVSPEQKEYLDGVRKKAFKAYQHFRKGKVKWHDDIYEYEFSEDASAGGFGLLEGMKRYCIIYPSELIIKGHGLYKKQHPDYPNGYTYEQQHLPFEEIQKLIGKLFDKYKVGIRLKDHTIINRIKGDNSQLTEENDGDDNRLDRLKKKAESYYKFFKRGKLEFGGIEYKYELSDDYDFTINRMIGVTHPILRPTGIMITNMSPESEEKIPMAEVIRFFNKHVFHKYGVVVSFTSADFIGDVKEQINENEGEESEEKKRELQRKKCESVYKFLKKGTFKQTYVNISDVDNYSYELSDEFEIITHKEGTPKIKCGAHIKCLTNDRKMRPHIVLMHLSKIFEKYHITLSAEELTGDINMVSQAKPLGYDD